MFRFIRHRDSAG